MVKILNRSNPYLGTFVDVTIQGSCSEGILTEVSQKIFNRIQEIEKLLSFHNQNSELSYINSHAYNNFCVISDEMQEVLSQAKWLRDKLII